MKTVNNSDNSVHVKPVWWEEQEVRKALYISVNDYLAQSSVRSVAFLARKSGVSYSTVRRIVQGKGEADLSSLIPLLKVVLNPEECLAFIQRFYPGFYQILESTFTQDPLEEGDAFHSSKNHLDHAANFILHLCAGEEGMKEEVLMKQVLERFGRYGMRRIEFLKGAQYLVIKEGHVYLDAHKLKQTSVDSVLQNICEMTETFNPDHLGSEAATLGIVMHSLSQQGLLLLKQAGVEYMKNVMAAYSEHRGGDKIFYMALMQNLHEGGLSFNSVHS